MKSFERLMLTHLRTKTQEKTDLSQFEYQENCCVEDAVTQMLRDI